MTDFVGTKIALFYQDKLIMIQRDDKPGVPLPGMWDLPGGANENDETPMECVVREVREELGVTLDPASVIWQKTYPAILHPDKVAYFMVAKLTKEQFEAIEFGNEGKGWRLTTIGELMTDPQVIKDYKGRVGDYLASVGTKA